MLKIVKKVVACGLAVILIASVLSTVAIAQTESATIEYKNATYTGEIGKKSIGNDGKPHGVGIMRYKNGNVYDGKWKDGAKHGKGIFRWKNGDSYNGDWYNDTRVGNGVFRWTDGAVYDGEWSNSMRHGKGIMRYDDGRVYSGDWYNDKRQGQGSMRYANGEVEQGEWANDEFSEPEKANPDKQLLGKRAVESSAANTQDLWSTEAPAAQTDASDDLWSIEPAPVSPQDPWQTESAGITAEIAAWRKAEAEKRAIAEAEAEKRAIAEAEAEKRAIAEAEVEKRAIAEAEAAKSKKNSAFADALTTLAIGVAVQLAQQNSYGTIGSSSSSVGSSGGSDDCPAMVVANRKIKAINRRTSASAVTQTCNALQAVTLLKNAARACGETAVYNDAARVQRGTLETYNAINNGRSCIY